MPRAGEATEGSSQARPQAGRRVTRLLHAHTQWILCQQSCTYVYHSRICVAGSFVLLAQAYTVLPLAVDTQAAASLPPIVDDVAQVSHSSTLMRRPQLYNKPSNPQLIFTGSRASMMQSRVRCERSCAPATSRCFSWTLRSLLPMMWSKRFGRACSTNRLKSSGHECAKQSRCYDWGLGWLRVWGMGGVTVGQGRVAVVGWGEGWGRGMLHIEVHLDIEWLINQRAIMPCLQQVHDGPKVASIAVALFRGMRSIAYILYQCPLKSSARPLFQQLFPMPRR